MPELPEVQTTVNGLNSTVKELTIVDVWTNYNSSHYKGKEEIKDPAFFLEFKKKIIGSKVLLTTRRAKNILIELHNGYTILIHMKMTGHLMYGSYTLTKDKKDPWKANTEGPLTDSFNRHIRLVFSLSDGKNLVLSDMRRFAKVTLLKSKDIYINKHLINIGPEPLDDTFTLSLFKQRLSKKPNGKVKTVLMDQSILAGVGNIYSDEVLWRSSVHPESIVKKIDEKNIKLIFNSIKIVLLKGIDLGGDSMSDYRNIKGERGLFQEQHTAYRKTGKKCSLRNCNGTIERKVVNGRSAHYCLVHQKLFS